MAIILVVDDHPINRAFLVTLLGYAGHHLHEAADGADALGMVRQTHPDLVIADVLMPTMDGYAFVRRLRADPTIAHTPVVFYTATYLEREAQALARDCGVDHVLVKPAPPDLILRTVAAILDHGPLAPAALAPADTFDRAHTRLLTDKLAAKVDELTAVNDRLAALLDLSQRLAAERDSDTLLQICCDAARKIIGAKYAALDVHSEDQPSLRHFHTSGMAPELIADLGQLPTQHELFAQLIAAGHPLGTPDIRADLRAVGFPPWHPAMASFLSVSIASATRHYGILYLADKLGAAEFGDEDEQVATMLASQLAVAYENAQRYDALQRHAAMLDREIAERKRAQVRQATQFAVTRIIAESENRYDAIPSLLETICRNIAWDLGEFWRVNTERDVLCWENDWRMSAFEGSEFVTTGHAARFAHGVGLPGRVWATGQPEWVANIVAISSPRAALALDVGFHSAFAFPILGGGTVFGVMVFFCRAAQPSDPDLLITMADIGRQIGQFFERAHAEERLWQYTQRLKTLHIIDQAILAAQSPEAIAQAALRHMRELAPCRAATVTVFNFTAQEALILAVETSASMPFQRGERIPLDIFLVPPVLQQGQPFVMEDLQNLPNPTALNQQALKYGVRSYLRVPIILQHDLIGSLNLFSDRPRAFAPEVIDVAREVGSQLAVAIQNARLFEQGRAGADSLRLMSQQLVRAQEDERRHIARELHDEVGQSLTAALLNLQVLGSLTDLKELPVRLDDSLSLIDRVLRQVRTLSLNLRPALLDDLGLAPALRWLVSRQAERAGFGVQFSADVVDERFAADIEITCFRAVQEAVTNIVRYAQAQYVTIELFKSGNELCIRIRDDGIGFDVAAALQRAAHGHSMGLLSMQERVLLLGGRMQIESAPGYGSRIKVCLPLAPPTAAVPAPAGGSMP